MKAPARIARPADDPEAAVRVIRTLRFADPRCGSTRTPTSDEQQTGAADISGRLRTFWRLCLIGVQLGHGRRNVLDDRAQSRSASGWTLESQVKTFPLIEELPFAAKASIDFGLRELGGALGGLRDERLPRQAYRTAQASAGCGRRDAAMAHAAGRLARGRRAARYRHLHCEIHVSDTSGNSVVLTIAETLQYTARRAASALPSFLDELQRDYHRKELL